MLLHYQHNNKDIKMQIRFSFETKYGTYSDALNLPDDHNYTEQEIEVMKISRRDNWVSYIDSTQVEQPYIEEIQVEEQPTIEPTEE
jgi:hypothetical protein